MKVVCTNCNRIIKEGYLNYAFCKEQCYHEYRILLMHLGFNTTELKQAMIQQVIK